MYQQDFDKIRPLNDNEINTVLNRLTKNPFFYQVISNYFPQSDYKEIINNLNNTHSVFDFQRNFMYKIIEKILASTSNEVSISGIENLSAAIPYLFISNHRDIVLDSAILQKNLFDNNFPTTEIAFGNNLMDVPLISELGSANKMFIVKRGGNIREILKNSTVLSSYIRYVISEKKTSVWIAQRNGRTKDGNDKTEIAVLKMLNLSGKKSAKKNILELNITPVSISYEFEPCDSEKVKEIYCSKNEKYEKKTGEDTSSIIKGIKQYKSKIHLAFCNTLSEEIINTFSKSSNAEFFKELAEHIDYQIVTNFKLWTNNYIAYDLLENTEKYKDKYSEKEKINFLKYKNEGLSRINGNKDELSRLFLKLYANPLLYNPVSSQ